MSLIRNAKLLLTIVIAAVTIAGKAQSSDQMHQQMHQQMLADQVNIHKEVNLLDSVTMLYRLQEEELLFPALDLYESWNNDWVNPYRGQNVKLPDSLKIDVSDYFLLRWVM